MLSIIVAMDQNGTIGRADGGMPWHLPVDLARFKALTMGKTVVFGYKTWAGINKDHLPGRKVLVATYNGRKVGRRFGDDWLVVATLLTPILNLHENSLYNLLYDDEIFIAGGREIYKQTLPLVNRIYLTEVDGSFDGEVMFPDWKRDQWVEKYRERCEGTGPNAHPHTYSILERKGV